LFQHEEEGEEVVNVAKFLKTGFLQIWNIHYCFWQGVGFGGRICLNPVGLSDAPTPSKSPIYRAYPFRT